MSTANFKNIPLHLTVSNDTAKVVPPASQTKWRYHEILACGTTLAVLLLTVSCRLIFWNLPCLLWTGRRNLISSISFIFNKQHFMIFPFIEGLAMRKMESSLRSHALKTSALMEIDHHNINLFSVLKDSIQIMNSNSEKTFQFLNLKFSDWRNFTFEFRVLSHSHG